MFLYLLKRQRMTGYMHISEWMEIYSIQQRVLHHHLGQSLHHSHIKHDNGDRSSHLGWQISKYREPQSYQIHKSLLK